MIKNMSHVSIGKYVPELAELIHEKNKDPSLYIPLKGILLGNAETSTSEDWSGMVDYAWSHAVVSDETHKIITNNCDFNSNDPWSNDACSDTVASIPQFASVTLALNWNDNPTQVMMKQSSKMMPRIMGGFDPCLDDYAKTFYNRLDVQKALHVSDGIKLRNWSICNGDTDGRVSVLSTRYSLNALGLPITKSRRPWHHEKQVSGWYQEYAGLTFATFRGDGHAK
ncbi:hypothetical protein Ddye_019336 [Dipteronia dyeriana]|uniref:Serine carboxypeptidase n=1 Tax=Dipteronia dyeriana TaxID=168575 RepID=A0AAD9TXT2_9ROSI|nr:hypothetical protein Ddye_019336 [Dipteronia dyeriana]